MSRQIINIPDKNFKDYLISTFDKDNDGELSIEEAVLIENIYCRSKGIKSLKGIENFLNLKHLDSTSNDIESIDLQKNKFIESLTCTDNFKLAEIHISNCISLAYLNCIQCQNLKNLDISKNIKLKQLYLGGRGVLMYNPDFSKHIKLEKLSLRFNNISKIDLRNNFNLKELNVRNCNLTELNVSNNHLLEKLDCRDNELISLNLPLGANIKDFQYTENESLEIITVNILPIIKKYSRLKIYVEKGDKKGISIKIK